MRQDGLIDWSSPGIQTRDENLRDGPQSPSVRTSASEDKLPGAGLIGTAELLPHRSPTNQDFGDVPFRGGPARLVNAVAAERFLCST